MENFELNKIIGAVLGSLLFVMGLGFVADYLYAPDKLEQQAYVVEVEMSDDNHGGESVHVEEKVSLAMILAGGDAEKGRRSAKKCASCHTFDSGGANKVGPNLYGIVGRGKGEVDGFAYSKALAARTGETWTYEDLDAFIGAPKSWLPGTKMAFSGIKKPIDRGNIITYLRTLSPNAPALPEPEK
jgi:cytochrome c